MKLLEDKKGIIFGVANEKSIAWACAKTALEHGASVGITYLMPEDKYKKYLKPVTDEEKLSFAMNCDATNVNDLAAVFEKAKKEFGGIDFIVHSMAMAKKGELDGHFSDTSRDGFQLAMDVSTYTLIELSRYALPLMKNGGSITTMTYIGAEKVMQNYNIMGVAKAALEASVRYLANDLGEKGIRVNAISCGSLPTRAASGIAGFENVIKAYRAKSPLKRDTTIEDVGKANLFLISDLSSGITGHVLYVDTGVNIMGIA